MPSDLELKALKRKPWASIHRPSFQLNFFLPIHIFPSLSAKRDLKAAPKLTYCEKATLPPTMSLSFILASSRIPQRQAILCAWPKDTATRSPLPVPEPCHCFGFSLEPLWGFSSKNHSGCPIHQITEGPGFIKSTWRKGLLATVGLSMLQRSHHFYVCASTEGGWEFK